MSLRKPAPRTDYAEHVSQLGEKCAFCEVADELNIREYGNWVWKFSAFPYRKHHTLLVPKRHLIGFSTLSSSEMLELPSVLESIEKTYRKSAVVGDSSEFGDQLFVSWRERSPKELATKKPVAHFHIHLYPRFNNGSDTDLDNRAFDIDTDLLRT